MKIRTSHTFFIILLSHIAGILMFNLYNKNICTIYDILLLQPMCLSRPYIGNANSRPYMLKIVILQLYTIAGPFILVEIVGLEPTPSVNPEALSP